MKSFTDQELLRAYSREGSEAAFAELARRHVDFVYSSALRMARNPQIAEDVAQGVFVALARNARQLAERPVLAGWLHRTTRNLAAKAVRGEVRRRAREQEAANMNENENAGSAWEMFSPQLDAALDKLKEADREVVLLRFFQQKSAREIGESLGLSEEAAQKRALRALERLRDLFAEQGVSLSTAVIASSLAAHAVQAAPTGLTASVAGASLGAKTTGNLTSLIKALIMTKTKIAIVAAVVAAAGITPIAWRYHYYHSGPEAWKRRLDATYELGRNEIVKHIAPPFTAERQHYYETEPSLHDQYLAIPSGPNTFVFVQGAEGLKFGGGGFGDKAGFSVDYILSVSFGLRHYEFEAPARLMNLKVTGDWTIREGASREAMMAALGPELSKATGRKVRFDKQTVGRPVILAHGTLAANSAVIDIYAEDPKSTFMGTGQGGNEALLVVLGDILKTRMINETDTNAPTVLNWEVHGDVYDTKTANRMEKILENISNQTGLKFEHETRPVEVWFLSEKR